MLLSYRISFPVFTLHHSINKLKLRSLYIIWRPVVHRTPRIAFELSASGYSVCVSFQLRERGENSVYRGRLVKGKDITQFVKEH